MLPNGKRYSVRSSNPDDPNLEWYRQYVNCSRPLEKYRKDYPEELLEMLSEPPKRGWVHWYFTFDDNAALTPEKREQIISAVPKGTKQYFTKILGLRRKTTGLVFSNFERKRHVVSAEQIKSAKEKFVQFSCALDTAYSSKSADTLAFSFVGITESKRLYVLEESVYNNAELAVPIAPSDTAKMLVSFASRCCEKWGVTRDIFIDSADAATLTECAKYKNENGCFFNFNPAWKKMKILDRINLQLGWLAHGDILICDSCRTYISELERYCWLEGRDGKSAPDSAPEDGNDHMINSVQYAFLPYIGLIGGTHESG